MSASFLLASASVLTAPDPSPPLAKGGKKCPPLVEGEAGRGLELSACPL